MGILPGVTTIAEATDISMHLGIQAKIITEGKVYEIDYLYNDEFQILASLFANGPIISNLTLYINPLSNAIDPQDWLAFSPKTLINRYGQPSRVEFDLLSGPRTLFTMDIYYDTVDMIVEFAGYNVARFIDSVPSICPLKTQFDIEIWMGKDPIHPPLKAVPLEQATSLTLEGFSKLMIGNPDQACFQLDKNLLH